MNEENRELLEQVVKKRLSEVLDEKLGTEEETRAFKEAMDAIDREITLRKLDDSYFDEAEKRGFEKEKFEASRTEKTALMAFEEKKLQISQEEQTSRREMDAKKQNSDEAYRDKESKRGFWIGIGTIVGTAIVGPVIQYVTKRKFAKTICNFEKDYTFTTSAGRSLGGLFRFKD